MGIGQGIRTGLRHGGITCVLQTRFATFFFLFFFGGGGGAAGEHGHLLKGTLENNLLFLGHKTNVRGCLKIILRNKADHKKNFVCRIPAYPHIFPLPNTFSGTSWKQLFFFGPVVIKKITVFPFKIQGRGIANT